MISIQDSPVEFEVSIGRSSAPSNYRGNSVRREDNGPLNVLTIAVRS